MNLSIDIGNGGVKAAVFEQGKMLVSRRMDNAEIYRGLGEMLGENICESCIIGAVADYAEGLVDWLGEKGLRVMRVDGNMRLPFVNECYAPATLGADRIAAVAAAQMLLPKQNVLVVDVGSCITFDILLSNGHYAGGNIAPGLRMRLLSMHEHTSKLPLVEPLTDAPTLGNDTVTAMSSGAMMGLVYEIEGYARHLASRYGDIRLLLTGGDSAMIKEKLTIQATSDSRLVLRGLDYILRYNEHKV